MPNARIPWATRKLCVLILFAEDVDPVTDPDKLVRRYHWEVKGFVKGAKGAFKCSLSLTCEGRQFFTMQLLCSSAIQSEHHLRVHIGGQNGDAIRAVPAKDRAASTVHETCFRVLILCCIATPTGQLTRRLFYRLLHRLFQCLLLLRLGHCGLCSKSSCFTEWCIHCACALLQQLRCCLLHSSCVTPCFDLINSGEQCN